MGRFGFHSGYMKAQNVQAGTASVTLDSNGDGTQAITFKRKFKNIPIVMVTAQTSDDTLTTNASLITKTGFTIHADGGAITGTSVTVGYFARDDPATGFA